MYHYYDKPYLKCGEFLDLKLSSFTIMANLETKNVETLQPFFSRN